MAGFMMLCGIAGAKRRDVERVLRASAREQGGKFARDATGLSFPDGIVIAPGKPGRLSIMYPAWLRDWEQLTKRLSNDLSAPVFLFHIHDGDFWMYSLFAAGQEVDHFNPIPDYWDDNLSTRDRQRCTGNSRKLAKYWPDLTPASIKNYLVSWNLDSNHPGQAYPDDQYGYNDCRQLTDFMHRLGLTFPLDDEENPVGSIYSFECRVAPERKLPRNLSDRVEV